MSHNERMLTTNKQLWGDRVRIVGVSLDKTPEIANKHVKAKGWKHVEHLHVGGSDAADSVYQVKGIPHIVLVDTKGIIVYAGSPYERNNLEEDINMLLAGKNIHGAPAKEADSIIFKE